MSPKVARGRGNQQDWASPKQSCFGEEREHRDWNHEVELRRAERKAERKAKVKEARAKKKGRKA